MIEEKFQVIPWAKVFLITFLWYRCLVNKNYLKTLRSVFQSKMSNDKILLKANVNAMVGDFVVAKINNRIPVRTFQ